MKNYYEILEVNPNASDEVINRVYKLMAKKYHPDLQPENKKKEAQEKFKIINEAYEVLSDPVKRANYDQQLKQQNVSYEQYQDLKTQNENLKRQINNLNNSSYQVRQNPVQNTQQKQQTQRQNTYQEPTKEQRQKIPFKVKLKAYSKYYFKLFLYKFSGPISLILTAIIFLGLYKLGILGKIINFNTNNINSSFTNQESYYEQSQEYTDEENYYEEYNNYEEDYGY